MFSDYFFFFWVRNFCINKVLVSGCFLISSFSFSSFFSDERDTCLVRFKIRMRLLISSLVRYRYREQNYRDIEDEISEYKFYCKERKGVYLSFISFWGIVNLVKL